IGIICETSDRRKFMFTLDEVIAKREVVIKSLGAKFSGLKGISSGTVLSGGKIGLVVDIDEIVSLSLMEIGA
ncbi:MAG: chemotaxis protein CheW, partial [Spirochaetales bacterium]|nr:chemotaxis protein CheW [Spirochaetales bacterium]